MIQRKYLDLYKENLVEMWQFLKKHWLLISIGFICVLFFVVGMPLIINWIFKQPALCEFFVVDWEAKDALAYYGSALGFLGTVIFSALALWQNHMIKTESNKRQEVLDRMEVQKHMPIIEVRPSSCSGSGMHLSFNISNVSENVALDIVVSKIQILNNDGSEFWINDREYKYQHLGTEAISISLKNPQLTDLSQIMVFRISFKDKFEKYHTLFVEGKQTGEKITFPKFCVTEKQLF